MFYETFSKAMSCVLEKANKRLIKLIYGPCKPSCVLSSHVWFCKQPHSWFYCSYETSLSHIGQVSDIIRIILLSLFFCFYSAIISLCSGISRFTKSHHFNPSIHLPNYYQKSYYKNTTKHFLMTLRELLWQNALWRRTKSFHPVKWPELSFRFKLAYCNETHSWWQMVSVTWWAILIQISLCLYLTSWVIYLFF